MVKLPILNVGEPYQTKKNGIWLPPRYASRISVTHSSGIGLASGPMARLIESYNSNIVQESNHVYSYCI